MRQVLVGWLLLGLLMVLPCFAVAAPIDLSGTWALDLEASDSLDPLMKARGMGWMKRKLAANMEVTQVIVQQGDTLEVQLLSAVRTESMTLHVDGKTREETTSEGPSQVSHRWSGDALETRSEAVRDGVSTTARIVRTVEDGGKTMRQRMEVRIDGVEFVVNRVFRAAAPE